MKTKAEDELLEEFLIQTELAPVGLTAPSAVDAAQIVISTPWAKSAEDVLIELESSDTGLSQDEAEARLAKYGENALPEEELDPWWKALLSAFMDKLTMVLLVTGVISAIVGLVEGVADHVYSAIALFVLVLFMAVSSFLTERFAGAAIASIKKMVSKITRVYRSGVLRDTVPVEHLVPGDVITLQQGDIVPADAIVIRADRAQADESLLTGESEPVKKQPGVVALDTDLAHRSNMLHSGSHIVAGTLTAVLATTGMNTYLASIWDRIQEAEEGKTPLEQQLDKLAGFLMNGTLIVCVAVVLIYILRGQPILEALMLAVALAIAFIPEALGTVITVCLAFGRKEMSKYGAIIRKLRAAEGLGSVSVVCTDKTGTITEGKMTATSIWTAGKGNKRVNGDNGFFQEPEIARLIRVAHMCNDIGNPTEQALAALAQAAGFELSADTKKARVHDLSFTSERKLMTTVHNLDDGRYALSKGAPDRLISLCTHIIVNGERQRLSTQFRQMVHDAAREYESHGQRVLAFADRDLPFEYDENRIEEQLTFIGLVAISDPPRPEVRKTVHALDGAGITAVMITGDSPLTALSIAKETHILPATATLDDVVLGREVDELTANGLDNMTSEQVARIANCRVFARTSPINKIDIVEVMQRAGKLVAMTGDGVNDAPSIKKADVGIAMATGTEVTKSVADVVLKGTYSAIAEAVRVGRTILHRTRLYSHALLSTNGAEVLLFIVAVIAGWPPVLTALQLLFINVLGDGWLSIALTTEPAEKDVMTQPPRHQNENIITPYMYASIGLQSVVTTAVLVVVFLATTSFANTQGLDAKSTIVLQQTMIFLTFMVQKVLRSSFTARSLKYTLWQIGPFSNPWTLVAALLTAVLTIAGLYFPLFGMTPPPAALLPYLALGLIPPAVEELVKVIRQAVAKARTARKPEVLV